MDTLEKAEQVIKGKKIVLIGSVGGQKPYIKAALLAKREGPRFYFASNLGSLRAKQFEENPSACLYFFNRLFYRGVLLEGAMEVLSDAETKRVFWKPGYRFIYKGTDDPDYCVLRFTAQKGRYYSDLSTQEFTF